MFDSLLSRYFNAMWNLLDESSFIDHSDRTITDIMMDEIDALRNIGYANVVMHTDDMSRERFDDVKEINRLRASLINDIDGAFGMSQKCFFIPKSQIKTVYELIRMNNEKKQSVLDHDYNLVNIVVSYAYEYFKFYGEDAKKRADSDTVKFIDGLLNDYVFNIDDLEDMMYNLLVIKDGTKDKTLEQKAADVISKIAFFIENYVSIVSVYVTNDKEQISTVASIPNDSNVFRVYDMDSYMYRLSDAVDYVAQDREETADDFKDEEERSPEVKETKEPKKNDGVKGPYQRYAELYNNLRSNLEGKDEDKNENKFVGKTVTNEVPVRHEKKECKGECKGECKKRAEQCCDKKAFDKKCEKREKLVSPLSAFDDLFDKLFR